MSSSSVLILLAILFVVLHRSSSPAAANDLIEQTCKQCAASSKNVDYDLCVASLSSVPKSSHAKELRDLAMISVNIAAKNATQARLKAKKLLRRHAKDDKYMISCLQTCIDVYSGAVFDLQHSNKAIKRGQYADVNIYISSAVDAPVTCEDGFKEGGIPSLLSKENSALFKLTVIPLAMTTCLCHNSHPH